MTVANMISAASGVIEPPDLWQARLPQRFSDLCPRIEETVAGLTWRVGKHIGEVLSYPGLAGSGKEERLTKRDLQNYSSSKGRIWIQNRDSVTCEVLYSVGQVWDLIARSGDDEFIQCCYGAYNDWASELQKADPARFVCVAKIPTTGIGAATAEIERAGRLGLRSAVLDVWPAGAKTPVRAKKCDGFWAAAAQQKMPVAIYRPLSGDKDEEFDDSPEFIQDISAIMFANIFDRYPDLKIVSVAPHVGWALRLFEQMSDQYMRTAALRKSHLGNSDMLPGDYMRSFVWYTTQNDRTTILNRTYFGAAHLMFASFAFMPASSWPNTRQMFARVTSGMNDDEQLVLADEVASRLYLLGNAKPFSLQEANEYLKYGLL